MVTSMSTITDRMIMSDQRDSFSPLSLLRQQSWLSPAFPTGSYSYSHAIEWAVEAGDIHDRESLVDWLDVDLRCGSGRNEAIFFMEAMRCTIKADCEKLLKVAELAAAFRGTAEFALETSQQAASCLVTLRRVWPDPFVETLSELLSEFKISPTLSVVLGVRTARQDIPAALALPAFLQSYLANLITAGVRLVPLGQTDGQLGIAELESAVVAVAAQAEEATIHDLGSAAFLIDLASASHETQYTRLFRS
jgi:urease accessory protein